MASIKSVWGRAPRPSKPSVSSAAAGSSNSSLDSPRSAFDRCHRTPLPLIRLQNLLAQSQRFRRDLDELIVGNKFNRLLKIEIAVRHEADRLIRSRSPHVGQLLLADNVDVEIRVLCVLADNHAFVNGDARAREKRTALLQIVESVRSRNSVPIGDQRARRTMRNLSLPLDISVKQRIHDDSAASVGKQRAA